MKSSKDAYEVSVYAQTGSLIRKLPKLLLKNPDNQKLFSPEELEELLKKAGRP